MQELLKTLLLAVITAVVPVLTGYGVAFIRKLGDNATANTENITAQTYIKEVTDAIADAVSATNQTYVDALKNAGNFTPETQKKAAQKSLDACIASISPAALAFVERAYGDASAYLKLKIEAEVRKQKNAAPVLLGQVLEASGVAETAAQNAETK